MEPVNRKDAIKIINEVFEKAFGSEKGSSELYIEFMENFGLAEYDDDDNEIKSPPGQWEFLFALGVTPEEFFEIYPGINRTVVNGAYELYKGEFLK